MANQQIATIYKKQDDFANALKHYQIISDENPDDELVEEILQKAHDLCV